VPLVLCPAAAAAEAEALLARIQTVGKEGAGNVEASKAWRELVRLGPDALSAILTACDRADAAAANWLRAAVDAIAERTLAAGRPLPVEALEQFIHDTRHAPTARRLAYEWLARADAKAPDRLLPGMLNDPSIELRRDAVARVLAEAEPQLKNGDKAVIGTLRKAFDAARDRDQVDLLAKHLKALGVETDGAAHFGSLQRWALAGPFDNAEEAGLATVYPPEKGVDRAAVYKGKKGAEVRWIEYTTTDPYGLVDLNKALGKQMGVTAYAFAVVDSPKECPVEVRAASFNAVKLFLNGKEIFARDEYHHGMYMDQHVGVGTLKAGRNEILIKICQNEQKEAWAQSWSFQLRLCDAVGGAVPFTVVTDKPKTQSKEGKEQP
jgi:hypothetical protein